MQIELEQEIFDHLEAIAHSQGRPAAELAEEIIRQYIAYQQNRDAFRAKVRGYMQEHAWLLDELAKR